MPVVINEFEAVAEPAGETRGGDSAGSEPRRALTPPDLRAPLRILAARHARVRAH